MNRCGQLGAAAGASDSRSNDGRCLDALTGDCPVVVDNFTWCAVHGGGSTSTGNLVEPVSNQLLLAVCAISSANKQIAEFYHLPWCPMALSNQFVLYALTEVPR